MKTKVEEETKVERGQGSSSADGSNNGLKRKGGNGEPEVIVLADPNNELKSDAGTAYFTDEERIAAVSDHLIELAKKQEALAAGKIVSYDVPVAVGKRTTQFERMGEHGLETWVGEALSEDDGHLPFGPKLYGPGFKLTGGLTWGEAQEKAPCTLR